MLPVNWAWVALAAVSVLLVSAGKALRWRWLYPPDAPSVPGAAHFSILLIAQMLNLIVPVRLGEIARLGLMQQEGRPAGMTLGTIVVEKSLDLLAVGVVLMLIVPMAVLPDWLRLRAGPGTLLTGLALLSCLLFARLARERILSWIALVPTPRSGFWSRARDFLVRLARSVLDGIAGVDGRRVAPVTALTVLIWLISAGAIQAMLLAFGIGGLWQAAVLLMLALTFSNIVPAPPALIGVVGALAVAVLVPFGIPAPQALMLGTLLNAVMVLPPVLLGGCAIGARLLRLIDHGGYSSLRQLFGLTVLHGSEGD